MPTDCLDEQSIRKVRVIEATANDRRLKKSKT